MPTWLSVQNLIGGMALGFEREFGAPAAIVTNSTYNDTLYIDYTNEQRHLNVPVINANHDFTEFDNELPKVDIIVMTPACAGLSNMAISCYANRSIDSGHNLQMRKMLEFALRQSPKVIAFENAPALYQYAGVGANLRRELVSLAHKHGYSCGFYKTDTRNHGLPQRRHRTFAVFYKDSNAAKFEFENLPFKPFSKFIKEDCNNQIDKDIIDSPRSTILNEFITEQCVNGPCEAIRAYQELGAIHSGPIVSEWELVRAIGLDKFIEHSENRLKELSPDDSVTRRQLEVAIRGAHHLKEKIAQGSGIYDISPRFCVGEHINAYMAKCKHIHHPFLNRVLSIGEILKLMGFPDDFHVLKGAANIKIIGQNVPVNTANWVARNVHKFLNGELELASGNLVMMDNIKTCIDHE